MARLAVLLLVASAWGQSRPTWGQLASEGTQPRVAWQRGLKGRVITNLQAPAYTVAVAVVGDTLEITGPAACTVRMRPTFTGLVVVAMYNGRVGVLAGHIAGDVYWNTLKHVELTGPCAPVETVDGRYPEGIHAFVYFASVRQPTGSAPLKGVPITFMPTSYGMNVDGLTHVSGTGHTAVWMPSPGTIMNGRFPSMVDSVKP